MRNQKLASTIATVLGGAALMGSVSTASAGTTMYNKYVSGGVIADGTGACGSLPGTVGGACAGAVDGFAGAGWVGTAALATAAYGYTGAGAMMWGANLTSAGDSVEISSQDSFDRYGIYADIDTAKGAWLDPLNNFGWKHDLEVGLFKSDVTQSVTLSMAANNFGGDFGFTILSGMNSNTHAYSHHGSWNQNHDGTDTPSTDVGTLLAPDVRDDYSDNASIVDSTNANTSYGVNTITFTADAGQLYTILAGGYRNGHWSDTNDGYTLTISGASPVPVPAAVWLFGSALAGLGVSRRKVKQA